MAMRVRKLARELQGTSGEVLGVLRDLGLERYRSPEDMLPAAAVDKVRRAWRKGQRGPPVAVAPASPRRGRPRQVRDDLMSQLVPGVVPVSRRDATSVPSRRKVDAPLEEIADQTHEAPDRADLDAEWATLAAERAEVEEVRAGVEEAEEALEAERAVLEGERAVLEGERAALEEARGLLEQLLADVESRAGLLEEKRIALLEAQGLGDPSDAVRASLVEVLEDRGLRGFDEFERALGALAQARRLRDLLPLLAVQDPTAVLESLRESLILVGGDIPESLPRGRAGVQVAPDREELPGWESLRRDLGRVGELFLLHGLRRVVVVGGHPTWQRLLREGVDPRVDLRFQQTAPRPGEEADSDLGRIDALVFWGGGPPEGLENTYGGSRIFVVQVDGRDLPGLVRVVCGALEEE